MIKRAVQSLDERKQMILGALIREYTKTAHPVGSFEILRHSRLDVSPATIRNELLELCDLGYLEQPHTSAGRIPTDKGYRFFVDNIISEISLDSDDDYTLRKVFGIREEDEFLREFGRVVSGISGLFASVSLADKDFMYETGFSEVLDEPESKDPENIRELGELIDLLGKRMHTLFDRVDAEEEEIFIGEENPLHSIHSYSMIVSHWSHPRGFRGYMTLVSPKRTDYAKHKAVVKRIKNHESR